MRLPTKFYVIRRKLASGKEMRVHKYNGSFYSQLAAARKKLDSLRKRASHYNMADEYELLSLSGEWIVEDISDKDQRKEVGEANST